MTEPLKWSRGKPRGSNARSVIATLDVLDACEKRVTIWTVRHS
jgi:hypothetical protein